jgi:hypothetical protein
MSDDYIDSVCPEIARVLKPSGYLMRWIDTFCSAIQRAPFAVRLARDAKIMPLTQQHIKPVDLIAWDSPHPGMGKRSRRRGDYLLVLQKDASGPPRQYQRSQYLGRLHHGFSGGADRARRRYLLRAHS